MRPLALAAPLARSPARPLARACLSPDAATQRRNARPSYLCPRSRPPPLALRRALCALLARMVWFGCLLAGWPRGRALIRCRARLLRVMPRPRETLHLPEWMGPCGRRRTAAGSRVLQPCCFCFACSLSCLAAVDGLWEAAVGVRALRSLPAAVVCAHALCMRALLSTPLGDPADSAPLLPLGTALALLPPPLPSAPLRPLIRLPRTVNCLLGP